MAAYSKTTTMECPYLNMHYIRIANMILREKNQAF